MHPIFQECFDYLHEEPALALLSSRAANPWDAAADMERLARQAEAARAPETEAALRHWLRTRSFYELEATTEFLVQGRVAWAQDCLAMLMAAPVYPQPGVESGEMLLAWLLFEGWQRYGLERWLAKLLLAREAYRAGLDAAREDSFQE